MRPGRSRVLESCLPNASRLVGSVVLPVTAASRVLGESLSAFLLRRRLERAASLLCSTDYANRTIMEIALECGFNSASHFGQKFREPYRVTPSAYRSLMAQLRSDRSSATIERNSRS
ncbi:MAG: helix-turn-helix transcriptional regulator [Pseudomonadota bacterium]